MKQFKSGDRISVYYRDRDKNGNPKWKQYLQGVFLTYENVGNGREMRISPDHMDEHIHLKESANDLKFEKE